MVGGQYIDVSNVVEEGGAELRRLHELKTGRLIGAAIECPLLLADEHTRSTTLPDFRAFATELGVLFQIVDDILDVTGTDVALGKPQGSDERHGKVTYVSRYGLDGARAMAAESHRNARAALDRAAPDRADELSTDHRLHRHPLFMTSLLSRIDRPQDLHALSEDELQAVAQEVRELLIDTVGEIGGHFGANLGTCEIAVAVHSLIDSPRDKVLWDVGHQAYPHKILTGRRDAARRRSASTAASRRSAPASSPSTTSWAPATPRRRSATRSASRRRCCAAAPRTARSSRSSATASMTGGVAFEAVSQAGGLGTPIVVILNDNGMSIAPNVGALSRYMNRVRLDPGLWEAREGVEEKLTKLPAGIGAAFERLGPRFKESVKAFWAPGLWWEELDWAYLGVIDGHDVRAMRRALRTAFEAERPVVIHCATVKGKGFAPAEDGGLEGMEKWHAAKPKSIAPRRARALASVVARAAAVHAGVRRGDGARVRARPAGDRHHRGDELRHRPVDPAEGDAGALLRRRHRRAAGACCSPPARR